MNCASQENVYLFWYDNGGIFDMRVCIYVIYVFSLLFNLPFFDKPPAVYIYLVIYMMC